MPLKMFQSTEDKMKEALLYCDQPRNAFVRNLAELALPPYINEFTMIPCAMEKMDYCPMGDLLSIEAKLRAMGVGLAWFEEPEILYASLPSISPIRGRVLEVPEDYEYRAWMMLVRLLWDSGVLLAAVTRYLEGYGIETFIKGGKAQKAFVPCSWDD